MDTQIDHAHMRIKTLNKKNDQSGSGAYLGIKRPMRYQESGLVHN